MLLLHWQIFVLGHFMQLGILPSTYSAPTKTQRQAVTCAHPAAAWTCQFTIATRGFPRLGSFLDPSQRSRDPESASIITMEETSPANAALSANPHTLRVLHPPSQLCHYCKSIPWREVPTAHAQFHESDDDSTSGDEKELGDTQDSDCEERSRQVHRKFDATDVQLCHYKTFVLLQNSADIGCVLCRHIWTTSAIQIKPGEIHDGESQLSLSIYDSWSTERNLHLKLHHESTDKSKATADCRTVKCGKVASLPGTQPRIVEFRLQGI